METSTIINQLRSANSTYEGKQLLQSLKKSELTEIGNNLNMPVLKNWSKEQIINRIISFTIQSRLDRKAISETDLSRYR